jgi:hypothetical protein
VIRGIFSLWPRVRLEQVDAYQTRYARAIHPGLGRAEHRSRSVAWWCVTHDERQEFW